MVGMETKNEKSRDADRDIPASWPAAIVDIDREVPGKTAERIWHTPTQTAWLRLMSSIFHVRMGEPGAAGPAFSHFDFSASTTHITMPPMSKDDPITARLSRFLPTTLVSRKEGIAVTTNAMAVSPSGWVKIVRSPRSPCGNVERNFMMRVRK